MPAIGWAACCGGGIRQSEDRVSIGARFNRSPQDCEFRSSESERVKNRHDQNGVWRADIPLDLLEPSLYGPFRFEFFAARQWACAPEATLWLIGARSYVRHGAEGTVRWAIVANGVEQRHRRRRKAELVSEAMARAPWQTSGLKPRHGPSEITATYRRPIARYSEERVGRLRGQKSSFVFSLLRADFKYLH
jgi:hypothetical protein